jgi:hypothetical protein
MGNESGKELDDVILPEAGNIACNLVPHYLAIHRCELIHKLFVVLEIVGESLRVILDKVDCDSLDIGRSDVAHSNHWSSSTG